jgi:hypothetical protein
MWGRAVSEAGAPTIGPTQAPSIGLKGEQLGPSQQPLKITLQGVQLCIANGERLLKDSRSVSEPSAFALAELALEETLKGWVLLSHHRLQEVQTPVANDEKEASINHFSNALNELSKVDVDKLFSTHQEKLKALEPTLNLVARTLSGVDSKTYAQIAQTSAPGITLMMMPSDADLRTLTGNLDRAYDYLQKYGARGLRRLAMGGLYVDRTDSGEVISPSCSSIVPAFPVQNMTLILLWFLRGIVTAALGAPPPGQG